MAEENKTWSDYGLEFLVELSQKGEIDPWDVDLVFVIDKFLSQLSEREGKQELQEAARIIFFVSVLLRLKSQKIYVRPNSIEEDALLDDAYGDLVDFDNVEFEEINPNANLGEMLSPRSLDRVLARNPKGLKEQRKRKITLDDLVTLFKQSEVKMSKTKKRRKKTLEDFEDEGEVVLREDEETDILELAHDENLEQKIQLLSEFILRTLDLNRETSLSELREAVGDWVDTFLSALFLSHSGKTELRQQEFYQEIWLKRVA